MYQMAPVLDMFKSSSRAKAVSPRLKPFSSLNNFWDCKTIVLRHQLVATEVFRYVRKVFMFFSNRNFPNFVLGNGVFLRMSHFNYNFCMFYENFEKHGSRKYTKIRENLDAFESVCEVFLYCFFQDLPPKRWMFHLQVSRGMKKL